MDDELNAGLNAEPNGELNAGLKDLLKNESKDVLNAGPKDGPNAEQKDGWNYPPSGPYTWDWACPVYGRSCRVLGFGLPIPKGQRDGHESTKSTKGGPGLALSGIRR